MYMLHINQFFIFSYSYSESISMLYHFLLFSNINFHIYMILIKDGIKNFRFINQKYKDILEDSICYQYIRIG
jgi:hypothetical protein